MALGRRGNDLLDSTAVKSLWHRWKNAVKLPLEDLFHHAPHHFTDCGEENSTFLPLRVAGIK